MNNFISSLSELPEDDLQKLNIRTKICYWATNSEVMMAAKQIHRAEKLLKRENRSSKQLQYTKLKRGKHKQTEQILENVILKTVQAQIT